MSSFFPFFLFNPEVSPGISIHSIPSFLVIQFHSNLVNAPDLKKVIRVNFVAICEKGCELEEFKESLEISKRIIKKDGIIVIISFHSLEDSIVKDFFKPTVKSFPKDIPLNNIETKEFQCIAKKIRPSLDEIKKNPSSRSAIMRVFQKI